MSGDNSYIQMYAPDKDSLAKALSECKGDERTMAQFAEATGVSPSTLSRILNGGITKPLSESVINSIFNNRSDTCKIKLRDFFRANGMVSKEERNRIAHGLRESQEVQEKIEKAQQILVSEMLRRGYAIKADDLTNGIHERLDLLGERTDDLRGDLPIRHNMEIYLPEMHDLAGWLFEIIAMPKNMSLRDDISLEENMKAIISRQMHYRYNVFLVDAWQPERLEGMKFSWVFTEAKMYTAFIDYFKTAKINNAMSVILVDLKKKVVLRETWMNCPQKADYVSLFRKKEDDSAGTDYVYSTQIGVTFMPSPDEFDFD